jgi:hypothetical protein
LRERGTVSSYPAFAKHNIEIHRDILASKQRRDNFDLRKGATIKAYGRQDKLENVLKMINEKEEEK